ncbi:MAG: phosphoribosylformylglycinamidine cyclo-ligase [Thermostichus sp. HHBFW_bins_43]
MYHRFSNRQVPAALHGKSKSCQQRTLGPLDYRSAGVDIDLGRALVKGIQERVERAKVPSLGSSGTLGGIGGFAGLFELPAGYQAPVLVAGTDGVGTKLQIAQQWGQHRGVGIDLVAMCVNDVLTVGAKPLFFLDYIATGKLEPEALLQVIEGILEGCQQAGCELLGGETAEMPGFYPPGEYDLAGFCVGIVEKSAILDGSQVQLGDRLLALPSSGIHSNGYSLVRRIVAERGWTWDHQPPGWEQPLGEVFLTPTRIYVEAVQRLQQAGILLHGMAHITGGGLPENLPRCLAPTQAARLEPHSWRIPPEFRWLQEQGQVEIAEMFRTFNLGVGYVLVVPPEAQVQVQTLLPEAQAIGEVVASTPPEAGRASSGENPPRVLGLENWGSL